MAANDLIEKSWIVYRAEREDRSYIGITSYSLERRWSGHCSVAKKGGSKSPLHRAIRRYGRGAFSVSVIYVAVNRREAIAVERGLISAYGTMVPNGYNLSAGGEGVIGIKKSPLTKERLSSSGRGVPRPRTPEHQAKLTARRIGYKFSDEAKRNMSLAHIGKTLPIEQRSKIGAAHRGRVHSERELANLDWTGRRHTEESKLKNRNAQLGRKRGPHSAEHKARISVSNLGRKFGPMTIEARRNHSIAMGGTGGKPEVMWTITAARKAISRITNSKNPDQGITKLDDRRWRARLAKTYIGTFATIEEARDAYAAAAKTYVAKLQSMIIELTH